MAELAGRVVVAGDHGTGQQRSICEGCWGRSPQTGRWVGGRAGKGSGRPFVLPGVGEPRELSGNRQRLGNCAGGSGQGPRLQPQLPASPLRRVFTALVGVAGGAGRSLPGGRAWTRWRPRAGTDCRRRKLQRQRSAALTPRGRVHACRVRRLRAGLGVCAGGRAPPRTSRFRSTPFNGSTDLVTPTSPLFTAHWPPRTSAGGSG